MHPVLFEVPWPALGVPLWPLFVLLALPGALVGGVAFRRGSRLTAALGAGLALAALVAALAAGSVRFSAGPFEVRSWSVFLASALALGSAVTLRRCARAGLDRDAAVRACIAAALGGIIGARVVWVLVHPSATGSVAGVFAFYRGGLSGFGALAGALVAVGFSARRTGASFFALLDAAAPSFGLGVFLTKVGCYLEGCDFGQPLTSSAPRFLAALGTFPQGSPAWTLHVLARGLTPSAASSLAVHPLEIYESLGGLGLVGLALAVERRTARPGFAFAGAALGYLFLRVSLDSLREDPHEMWVSRILFFLVVLAFLAFLTLRRFRPTEK